MLNNIEKLEMRPVVMGDINIVYRIVNSQSVREMSFDSHHISFEEHINFFHDMLNKKIPFYIFLSDSVPIGYVRFSPCSQNKESVLTVAVDTPFRGKGFGKLMVKKASEAVFALGVKKILVYVKQENTASKRVFEQSGFITEACSFYKGFPVAAYSLSSQGE